MPYSARPDSIRPDHRNVLRQDGKIVCPGCKYPFTGRVRPKPSYTLATCQNRPPAEQRAGRDRSERCGQKLLIRPNTDLTCDVIQLSEVEFRVLWDDRRHADEVEQWLGIGPWRKAA